MSIQASHHVKKPRVVDDWCFGLDILLLHEGTSFFLKFRPLIIVVIIIFLIIVQSIIYRRTQKEYLTKTLVNCGTKLSNADFILFFKS